MEGPLEVSPVTEQGALCVEGGPRAPGPRDRKGVHEHMALVPDLGCESKSGRCGRNGGDQAHLGPSLSTWSSTLIIPSDLGLLVSAPQGRTQKGKVKKLKIEVRVVVRVDD